MKKNIQVVLLGCLILFVSNSVFSQTPTFTQTMTPTLTPSPAYTPTATPVIYFVSIDGDDREDGKSWVTAWRTLTHACKPTSMLEGNTVIVGPGIYKYIEPHTIPQAPDGELFPIQPRSGMTITGSLMPHGSTLDERFITIIDAWTDYPDPFNNPRNVFLIDNKPDITIQNLKITGGNGASLSPPTLNGGGGIDIYNTGSRNIRIFNNYITKNYARSGGGMRIHGTGCLNYEIYVQSNYFVENCHIIISDPYDYGTEGGALEIGNASPIIEGNLFEHNFSMGTAPGINVVASTLQPNTKCEDGPYDIPHVIIRNNTFRINIASRKVKINGGDGAAIRADWCSEVVVEGNLIEENVGIQGAGINILNHASAFINNNIIRNNICIGNACRTPKAEDARGAGIMICGSDHFNTTGIITIINNEIYGNKAYGYCASHDSGGSPTPTMTSFYPVLTPIPNPTFVETYSLGLGGGICMEGSRDALQSKQRIKIYNNLVYNNYAGAYGAGVYLYNSGAKVDMATDTIHNNECFDDEYNQINSFVLQSMSTRSPTPTGTWFPPTSVFTCTSGGPSTYTPTATPTSIAREPVITMVNSIIWDDSLASSRERITSYVIPFSGPNIRLSDEHFHISYSDVKDGLQVGPPPTPYQGDATNLYNIPYFVSDCSSYDNYFLSDGEHYHSVCIDSGRDPVTTPAFYIEPLARPDPSWNATTTPTSAFIHPTPVYMSDYTTNSEHTPDLDTVDMGFHHPIRGCPPYIPAIGIFCILTLVLIVGGIIYYLERHHNLG